MYFVGIMWSVFVNAPGKLKEKYVICCCWIHFSIDVNYVQLIDGAVEFSYVFTERMQNLSIFDRGMLKSPTIIVVHLLLLRVLSVLSHEF